MSREEIQKLLGGYATDNLSETERRALMEAALDDQELFDALAKEQALRDVLQDPLARQQVLAALGPQRKPLGVRAWQWLRRPATMAMAGSFAILLLVAGWVLRRSHPVLQDQIRVADNMVAPLPAPEPQPPSAAKPTARRVPSRTAHIAPLTPQATDLPAPPPPAVSAGSLAELNKTEAVGGGAAGLRAPAAMPMTAMKRAKAALQSAGSEMAYSLLIEGPDGTYAPMPTGAILHAGDSVRLQVVPSAAGYIYLFERHAAAAWNLTDRQPVNEGQSYTLPATGGLKSEQPGRVELWLVLSRAEQAAFAADQTHDVDAIASKAQASVRITLEYR